MSTRRSFWKLPWPTEVAQSETEWLRRYVYPALKRAYPHIGRGGSTRRCNALPAEFVEQAEVPGYKDIRFWGDVYSETFERMLVEKDHRVRKAADAGVRPCGAKKADFLSISGGGDRGAFAAGVLAGWTARGDRPEFESVTGVSAGALAAPFAFLGPDYDDALHEIYTKNGAGQLYSSRGLLGFFSDALNDTSPLESLIREHACDAFLDRLAEEHHKGRCLFVMTTNLDAQRPVIWSLAAIAASGRPDRQDLFVNILRASSALPGLFPPVRIAVTGPDGNTYEELHVDGGVTAELIFVPPETRVLDIERDIFDRTRERALYVIENGKLGPEYKAVDTKILSLTGRAVQTMVKYQVIDNLLALSVIMKSIEGDFYFNPIPPDVRCTPTKPFDLDYAMVLYEAGRDVGRKGHWFTIPPLAPFHEPLLDAEKDPDKSKAAHKMLARRAYLAAAEPADADKPA